MNIGFRKIRNDDYHLLREMFYEAIFVPEGVKPYPETIIDLPELSKYFENWGEGDIGLVISINNGPIGAIWCRLFTEGNKGYGFIDNTTPELTMAIKREYRDKGFGSLLLNEFLRVVNEAGYTTISLSVDKRNRAVDFYKNHGFEIVHELETDYTMKRIIGK